MSAELMNCYSLFRRYSTAYPPQFAVVPLADGTFEHLRGFGEWDVRWMGH